MDSNIECVKLISTRSFSFILKGDFKQKNVSFQTGMIFAHMQFSYYVSVKIETALLLKNYFFIIDTIPLLYLKQK